ncbi:MAG: response regulator [candidate division WOR-3 bacterium]|nr:MAG: response regulator [candidate division WOR-3 bacterium]
MNPQKHILLVDDDEDFLTATKLVLEKSGYAVETCMSAKECIAKLKISKPDLIILDVMMESDHSGFDLCRELKRDLGTKEVPILMLTAIDQKYPMNFGSAAGDEEWLPVEGYVEKPVEANVLVERIKKLLRD